MKKILFFLIFSILSCKQQNTVTGRFYPNEYRPEFNLSQLSTISVSSSNILSGEESLILITTYDNSGMPMTKGGGLIYLNYSGTGSVIFSKVIDNNNGTYTSSFKGIKSGLVDISAFMNPSKNKVKITTQSVTIGVGSIDLQKSSVLFSSPIIPVGQTLSFTLTLKDLNNNVIDDNSLQIYPTLLEGTSQATLNGVNYVGNGKYEGTLTATASGTPTKVNLSIRRFGSVLSSQYFTVVN